MGLLNCSHEPFRIVSGVRCRCVETGGSISFNDVLQIDSGQQKVEWVTLKWLRLSLHYVELNNDTQSMLLDEVITQYECWPDNYHFHPLRLTSPQLELEVPGLDCVRIFKTSFDRYKIQTRTCIHYNLK